MKWTEEKIEDLKFAIELGLTNTEIGEIFDLTRDAIAKKSSRLGIRVNHNNGKVKTHEQYVKELAIKNPTIIVLEKYRGALINILHKCTMCGNESMCAPNHKLKGHGCIFCNPSNSKINYNKPGITYLIYFYSIDLYKAGVTGNTVKTRYYGEPLPYKIILERHFDTGIEAMKIENEWLSNIKEFKVINERTLVMELSQPDPVLFLVLSEEQSGIIDAKVAKEIGDDAFKTKAVTFGPCYVEEWVQGSHLVLKPNPTYRDYGPEIENKGPMQPA